MYIYSLISELRPAKKKSEKWPFSTDDLYSEDDLFLHITAGSCNIGLYLQDGIDSEVTYNTGLNVLQPGVKYMMNRNEYIM